MIRVVLILSLIALSACTPRARLVPVSADLVSDDIRSVYIGTTRKWTPEAGFSGRRSQVSNYLRYDISVPKTRPAGEITWPTDGIDPNSQFLLAGATAFEGPDPFRRDLAASLARRPQGAREAVIYVHGFNNRFHEGVLRITQLSEDFRFPGVSVHYSWPSAGNPLGYAYDRDSLLYARDGLERLVREVQASGADRVILVAHSVGAMLVMETLRQMAIARPGSVARGLGGVILISPDIDVELFRAQASRIGRLPQPFGLFVSKRDRALSLSARLTGQGNRLGNIRSLETLADLDVTVIDVTEFSTGEGHFVAGDSPAVISIFSRAGALETAFRGDQAGRTGLVPGTVLTVQNATEIILSPVTGLVQ
ncbi:MAG: alpha/beta fold hydrolase [Rhodobacter sp.]|nr:alpha/beta fold hydrolase [Rhodobacter sp.]